jgi:predicted RNA-binding protein with PUA-like domain
MNYWLMKSEPSEVSIDDLATFKNQQVEWFGVRNYQARNFMRDQMQLGDLAFFWHSTCKNPGIYGIVKIATKAHADSTQFVLQSEYFDPKSSLDNPRWWCVDVSLVTKTKYLSIQELREYDELKDMQVLQKGNRLSITPVTSNQWNFINKLLSS